MPPTDRREPYSKKVVEITPQLAREWIDALNESNYRSPSWLKVNEFAALMRDKKWFPRHPDAVQFDWYGKIGNGQHRLLAIVSSGETVEMNVERGIDPAAFAWTDKNRPRNLADDLAAAGFRRDVAIPKAGAVAGRMLAGLGTTKPPGDVVKEFALKYENLIGTVLLELKSAKPWRCEIAAAFCKATFEWDETKVLESARRFATKRFTGESDDPLARLLNRLLEFRASGGKAHELYAYAISAVRADLEHRGLARLEPSTHDFLGPWEEGYVVTLADYLERIHETMRQGGHDGLRPQAFERAPKQLDGMALVVLAMGELARSKLAEFSARRV
jgi:hypothetical protein